MFMHVFDFLEIIFPYFEIFLNDFGQSGMFNKQSLYVMGYEYSIDRNRRDPVFSHNGMQSK